MKSCKELRYGHTGNNASLLNDNISFIFEACVRTLRTCINILLGYQGCLGAERNSFTNLVSPFPHLALCSSLEQAYHQLCGGWMHSRRRVEGQDRLSFHPSTNQCMALTPLSLTSSNILYTAH